MYSAKTKGQFSDGICPPESDDIAKVDYGEGIFFSKIVPLTFSDKGSGWIDNADAHPLDGNAYEEVLIENEAAESETDTSKTKAVNTGRNTSISDDPQIDKKDVEHATAVSPNSAADNAVPLIIGMLDQAVKDDPSADDEILKLKQKISDLPKPAKGEIKSARSLNEQALSLFNGGKVAESIELFNQASLLDQSDPEILNNLGYALLRHGKLEEAKAELLKTLAISPGRAPAWQNIADIFTIQGDQARGIAAYENVYRFSKNRAKTHTFMKKLNDTDGSVLKDARQKAMAWAEKTYAAENLWQAIQQP
jgi:tetratricopeptide (TPR) repeat protein